jgi:hypothetical protein
MNLSDYVASPASIPNAMSVSSFAHHSDSEFSNDPLQVFAKELRVETVAKLDRAERREEESAPSDI